MVWFFLPFLFQSVLIPFSLRYKLVLLFHLNRTDTVGDLMIRIIIIIIIIS